MSLFKKIFTKEPKLPPVDLAGFGVDFHSHLIPGIDDGAPDMESSLTMLREFKALGYGKVITTPHVMCDYYKNTPEIILGGLDKVKEELVKKSIDIDVEAAAEYNVDDGLADLIKQKQLLTFGDNYVLFELPFMQEPPNFQSIVFDLQMAGYQPILAHPERYNYWHKTMERFDEIRAAGVLLQLNLLSLTGCYSPETKKVAEKLVENGWIDGVGTDCHRMDHLALIKDHLHLKHMHQLVDNEQLLNKKL